MPARGTQKSARTATARARGTSRISNIRYRRTSSVSVVECEVPPLVPVIVTVRAPVVARLPIVIVIVEVPAPVIDEGLKVTVFALP